MKNGHGPRSLSDVTWRNDINSREKFLGTCRFENVPPPRWDCLGFWGSTIERWLTEGLPADAPAHEYFGMDPRDTIPVVSGFCDTPFCPAFEPELISEDDTIRTWRDGQGIVRRERKDRPELSMPQFLEFPVKSREDWERMKPRLDPDTPERYPNWDELKKRYDGREYVLQLNVCGAYGMPRNLFGEENLAYIYYDDPELLHDIQRTWLRLYKGIVSHTFPNIKPDLVYLWEDMAFKTGPLISPRLFEEFMLPYYTELIELIRSFGVECVMVDSDGDNRPLLDLFIRSGVDTFMPLEIAAGMDPVPLREKYGRQLVLWGGIDKRALSKDLATVEREVMSKVPKLMETRGYIPSVDHSVPPDVPFENYALFTKLIREICG
ncbi:MAG: uroporphyrinogen decarboxylase family protein [Armatimonadota bacterium]|nr:uroporphyrinogen decarboxylase family protein [Armatimonadota bacterium]